MITCDFGAKNLDDFERLSDFGRDFERECVIIEILKECNERMVGSLILTYAAVLTTVAVVL